MSASDDIYNALVADANAGFVSPLTADAGKKIRAWTDAIGAVIEGGVTPSTYRDGHDAFAANPGQTVFALSHAPALHVLVFRAGVLEVGWALSGSSLTLSAALAGADDLNVYYLY